MLNVHEALHHIVVDSSGIIYVPVRSSLTQAPAFPFYQSHISTIGLALNRGFDHEVIRFQVNSTTQDAHNEQVLLM